jgi:putative endopeptidase
MRTPFFVAIIFVSLITSCQKDSSRSKPKIPTSDIPAKREFPVNRSLNPCVNFYEYACSEAIAGFKLREDRSRHVFSFHDAHERLLEFKKNYLKKTLTYSSAAVSRLATSQERQVAPVFRACMNESASKKEEIETTTLLLNHLKKFQSTTELLEDLGKKILSPEMGLLSFGVISNQDRPLRNDVYFDVSWMSLPERSYYQNPELMKELTKLVTSFFEKLNWPNAEARANMLVEFEKQLAQIYPTPTEFRELVSKRTKVTQKQLLKKYPSLAFAEALKQIPNETLIRDFMPGAYAFLEKKLPQLKLEELQSLILYYSLKDVWDDAYPDFYQQKFQFAHKYLGGPAKRSERDERCTRYAMDTFTKELDFILLPQFFPDFPEQRMIQLGEKIRQSVLISLRKNTWLTPSAKKEAIKKIETAKLQLVKPQTKDEWDFNPVQDYSEQTPIANSKKLHLAMIQKNLRELGQDVNPNRWWMGPLTVNAYYSPPHNKFVLPIAILQYPFFDNTLSEEENLAAIGTVIGHEIGHGIDDKGALYDSKGTLRKWLTKKDLATFERLTKPFIEQFEKIGHNGKLTLGENIGDFVGLSASYAAAFEHVPATAWKNSEEKKKRQQQFFLQYARLWCGVATEGRKQLMLKTDPHSLGEDRTNEQVKHQH